MWVSHLSTHNKDILTLAEIAGLYFSVINSVFNKTTVILPLPLGIPTADGLVDALNYVKADSAFLAPATIEDISKNAALLDQVSSKLELLFWSGGNLPQSAGDVVAARMHLYSCYGSSEYGAWPELRTKGEWPKKDWNYFRLHPSIGAKFRHRGTDLFELVLTRSRDNERLQTPFLHFPHLRAYPTNDLFTPHPTKPDFWYYRGRGDDIIVFLNGEKTNPISFEGHISSHPEVSAALMVGSQRMEASLLVELAGGVLQLSPEERAKTLERLWPKIEEANQSCPAHARIDKTHVLFADVPFLRAGKGTVQRKPTLQLYASRIDALYDDAEKTIPDAGSEPRKIDFENSEMNLQIIVSLIKDVGSFPNVTSSTDLFEIGLDSVHVLQLTRKLKEAFGFQVSPATIYLNPTPKELEVAIKRSAEQAAESSAKQDQERLKDLETAYQTYASQIDMINSSVLNAKSPSGSAPDTEVVLLTGSTGAIGSYMLHTLLETPSVKHVYCLNRSRDSKTQQLARNSANGLSVDFPEERVTFVASDLANPTRFGIEASLYQELLSKTTVVVHNAWPVNWNSPLSFFTPQLSSIVNLVNFAANASSSPRLAFISSISAVWNSSTPSAVPESISYDFNTAAKTGYGEAKLICERLLDHASRVLTVPVSILRVCQVAGASQLPDEGFGSTRLTGWAKTQWFPSMIISSFRHVHALPQSLDSASEGTDPTIDWITINVLPRIVLELIFAPTINQLPEGNKGAATIKVFNIANARKVSWSAFLPSIVSALTESDGAIASPNHVNGNKTSDMPLVPFTNWVDRLRSSGANEYRAAYFPEDDNEVILDNPGLKLLGFYAEKEARTTPEPVLDSTQAQSASSTLRELGALKPEWMAAWVRDWVTT